MHFKLSICLLCLGLLTPFPQIGMAQTDDHEGHNHPKGEQNPDTETQTETKKPLPPLSKQELIDQILAGRSVLKDQQFLAVFNYLKQVRAAGSDTSSESLRKTCNDLQNDLAKIFKALRNDQYISNFAGTEDDFAIAPLVEAQKTYKESLDQAQEDYAKVVAESLRRDNAGHLGTWIKSHLDTSIDIELMSQLTDWYWHHGHIDIPPGSFDSIIKLSYRIVQLEPQSPQVYCNAAWLLWSRWVSWKQDPEKMPIGEHDDQTAIKFLLQGRKACMDDAAYHHEAAMTVWGLARHHNSEYFNFIIDSLKLAEKAIKPDNQWLHIRIRLTLGHTYRQLKDTDNALKAYRSVLELDPKHEVAIRIIDELEHPEKQTQQQI